MKSEYSELLDGIRRKIDSDIRPIHQKLEFLSSENNKMKIKLLDYSRFEETKKVLEEHVASLKEENRFLKMSGGGSTASSLSSGRDLELELGQAISLNKKILGERDNLFYSFRELLKAIKKKKHTLAQSLQLMSNDQDVSEILKLAKEFNIKVQ